MQCSEESGDVSAGLSGASPVQVQSWIPVDDELIRCSWKNQIKKFKLPNVEPKQVEGWVSLCCWRAFMLHFHSSFQKLFYCSFYYIALKMWMFCFCCFLEWWRIWLLFGASACLMVMICGFGAGTEPARFCSSTLVIYWFKILLLLTMPCTHLTCSNRTERWRKLIFWLYIWVELMHTCWTHGCKCIITV